MKEKYNNLCVVGSIYSLLVYLSNSTDEDIENTFYVFTEHIPVEISSRFEHSCVINQNTFFSRKWFISWLYLRLIIWWKLPQLKQLTIFANDHLVISPFIIGSKNYILIEDSAYVCSRFYNGNRRKELQSFIEHKSYWIKKILTGETLYRHNGNNKQCIGVIQTTKDDAPYLKGKKILTCPLFNKWHEFSEYKKNFIKNVYNIKQYDIDMILSKTIILFTQPFYLDYITEKEHEEIYKGIISKYPTKSLLIKTHPRDRFDYKKINQDLFIFDKKIPSQLFDLFGIKYKVAITVNSSSVLNLGYKLDLHWYGTECNKSLLKKLGPSMPPAGAKVCKI